MADPNPSGDAGATHDTRNAQQATTEAATTNQPAADKYLFGMKQNASHIPPPPIFSDDYEKRLPEDPIYQETAPNARVWRAYVEEAATFDDMMIAEYRDGLDVMLVFAGLFSAVVTSFLVQVSQSLQADFIEMSAVLLHDLVSIQLAIAQGIPIANSTTPSLNPASAFSPDGIQVWINGLWVTSLIASLIVALATVLVKQWLHHYVSLPSGTPGVRSHVRQFRFMGLQRWRVHVIIGLLPITMHVSLTLFLSGLVLFFVPLRLSLAWTIGVLTVIVCALYIISNTIPMFFPDCPYKTPLTDFINSLFHYSAVLWQSVQRGARCLHSGCRTLLRSLDVPFAHSLPPQVSMSPSTASSRCEHAALVSVKQKETEAVYRVYDDLSVDGLDWLFTMSSNPSIHSIVVQAIGGLPVEAKEYADVMWLDRPDLKSKLVALIGQSTHDKKPSLRVYSGGCDDTLERLSRSIVVLSLPLKIEFNTIPQSISLATAEILTYQDLVPSTFYNFILSHHKARIHPLVWMRIIAMLHRGGVFTSVHQSDDAYLLLLRALILRILLPRALSSTRIAVGSSWAGPLELMSLQDTVEVYLQDTAHRYLLTILSSYDIPSVTPPSSSAKESSSHRIFLAAGHFAVHTLASLSDESLTFRHRNFDVIEESFGYLLGTVFRLHTGRYRDSPNIEYLTNWLLRLSPFLERMTPSQLL
ncbi:hypothetical protein BDZ89DRAFT_1061910 [Hymenopellis radicata]|nr:hypothetical protein BDZ89DRAFT_1061910 [Hymenopellis radicata]